MSDRAVTLSLFLALASTSAAAQQPNQPSDSPAQTRLTVQSNLVLVPAFVKTKHGDLVFSLEAKDFSLADDGIPQKIRLEQDTDSQPLALVIVVQTGGLGAAHLNDYSGLEATLEAIIGNVTHRVSVVSFDSHPHLAQDFQPDTEQAARTIAELQPGDQRAAILDALTFATNQLGRQPREYRRALLLISETVDQASQTTLDDTLRAIDDTNTAIYSFAFSTTKDTWRHEGSKLPNPAGPTQYSQTPYAPGGCMSRQADADPDAHGNRNLQALDCASDLLPPIRLARMAYLAAIDSMHRNVPETVAKLTGGEYFTFKDAKSLRQDLVSIANDVPNHYVLSFQPSAPHPGLHSLSLTLKAHPDLLLKARSAYWIDTPAAP